MIGTQTAGIVNFVDGFKGAQFAGISNYSYKSSIGGQFAGVFNKSEDTIIGAQVAGIMNIADHVEGTQIGLLNFNNSIDGVPVGFFSFSKKGLHQLELSTNEIFHANVAFKTGVNQFYNSFVGGIRFQGENPTIGVGYGIGTSIGVSRKSRFFFDLQAMHVHRYELTGLDANFLGKFTMSYQWQISPLFAIAAGPSFNALVTDGHDWESLAYILPLAPYNLLTGGYLNPQLWVGGHIALRFF